MIKVEVRGADEIKAKLSRLPESLHAKVLQPALNKVADKVRAEVAREIPIEYAVKASEVRSAIDVRRARGGKLEAVIEIFGSARKRGRSLNMIHFLAALQAAGRTVKARGVKATKADLAALDRQLGFIIKRAGGVRKIEGAFIGNKGRTIFRRVGKGRLPIVPVQVIGFAQMFKSRRIERKVMDKIRADLPIEVERAVQMLLAKGLP